MKFPTPIIGWVAILLLIGFMAGAYFKYSADKKKFIEYGCAFYDSITGEFTFRKIIRVEEREKEGD